MHKWKAPENLLEIISKIGGLGFVAYVIIYLINYLYSCCVYKTMATGYMYDDEGLG